MSTNKATENKEKIVENHLHPSEARWFAVYTQYKKEKYVVKELQQKGVNAYVPLQKLVRQYASRKKRVELPLITCYIFVKITTKEYIKVLKQDYVVKFVKFSNNLLCIPEREIETIKRVVGEGFEVTAQSRSKQWNVGDEVEVVMGGMTGMRGQLKQVKGKNILTIELETLQHTLEIDIPVNFIQKISL